MASFTYTALNVDGVENKGRIDAADSDSASSVLREQGLYVVDIKEASARDGVSSRGNIVSQFIAKNRSVKKLDLEFFFKQMAFMLRAGLPMLHGLKICEKQFKGRLGFVIEEMRVNVESGQPLSTAMKQYKTDVFPPIVANLVLAGERTGAIEDVLLRLSKYIERRRLLRSQTISAMIYPAVVVLVTIAVVAFLVGVVIPKFAEFLSGRGKQLPSITQSLIDISSWLTDNFFYIIGTVLLITIIVGITYNTVKGRLVLDRFLLKIPIIGMLLTNGATADFTWALAMMLRSGLTAFDSLKTTSQVITNRYISDHLYLAAEKIKLGKDLSSSIQGNGIPDLVTQMTTVGEQTGSLDQILDELGGFYQERLEEGVRRMAALIEPTLILIVAGIVGFVYIAFFTAIFALAK